MRSFGMGWLAFDLTPAQSVHLRDWLITSGIEDQGGANLFRESDGDSQSTH